MNPIAKAQENRQPLRTRFVARHEALRHDQGPAAACFLDRMRSWRVSMNMYDVDMLHLLEEGRHRNIYQKIEDDIATYQTSPMPIVDAPSQDQVFEDIQGAFGAKRRAYCRVVERERDIKYGAICAEGNGLSYYGTYTVFLNRTCVDAYAEMFILKTDSLNYIDDALNFDEGGFCEDLALKENVLELALLKHESDLVSGCDHALAQHCYARSAADRCYLEAQIYDDILTAHIEEVRWPQSLEYEVMEIGRRYLSGQLKLKDDADKCAWIKYQQHKRIQKKIRNFGIGERAWEDTLPT